MRLARSWCCLASVAAISAYRPTRSLPATSLPATVRQRGALVTLCKGGDAQAWPPPSVWLQQAGAMWVAAALLGPVCDGRHSAHDVLHYASDSIAGPPLLLQMGGQVVLETCWWVPVAFGGAGVVLGAAHPALDRWWGGGARPPPGWPSVLLSIGCFVACYDLSGALAQAAAESGAAGHLGSVDLPLLVCAAAWSGCPLGSALARLLHLLGAHLAALGSSALPGRGRPTGRPATASAARASRLQSRRSPRR